MQSRRRDPSSSSSSPTKLNGDIKSRLGDENDPILREANPVIRRDLSQTIMRVGGGIHYLICIFSFVGVRRVSHL